MKCSLVLTHIQSLNPTQRFATKLAQLTKKGWGELAGQRIGFGKLWMQKEPAAHVREGQGV
jgi:hypothetical protein